MPHDVVGPFDAAGLCDHLADCLEHGDCHDQRQRGRLLRSALRPEHQRHVDVLPRRGHPAPAAPAAPCGLHIRHNDRACRFPFFRKRLRVQVGGARLPVKYQLSPDPRGVQTALDLHLCEHIRALVLHEPVPFVILRLDHVAVLLKLFDHLPHSRARHAVVLTQFLPAHIVPGVAELPQYLFASHNHAPSVAAITALIVCMRFSASSNTRDRSDSNTSSVTSSSVKPYFSPCSLPIFVLRSWKAGRQ